jgi:hypothetical protein
VAHGFVRAMKASSGVELRAPFIPTALDGECGKLHTPAVISLGRRLGGPESQSVRLEKRNRLPLPGIEPSKP